MYILFAGWKYGASPALEEYEHQSEDLDYLKEYALDLVYHNEFDWAHILDTNTLAYSMLDTSNLEFSEFKPLKEIHGIQTKTLENTVNDDYVILPTYDINSFNSNQLDLITDLRLEARLENPEYLEPFRIYKYSLNKDNTISLELSNDNNTPNALLLSEATRDMVLVNVEEVILLEEIHNHIMVAKQKYGLNINFILHSVPNFLKD